MDDTFKSFLWFGAALALVIVGTMTMLGSVSIGELTSSRQGKLTEQVATLKSVVRDVNHRANKISGSLRAQQKQNAENEKRLNEQLQELAILEEYAILEQDLVEAIKTRDALLDEYAKKRAEILIKVRGTKVEEFTTAQGKTFKNVTINGDDGERVTLRSEFGGRSLTYDALSKEMQAVMGISPVIEEIKNRLADKPKAETKPKVVQRHIPSQVEEMSAVDAAMSSKLVTARERYKRLNRLIIHNLNEANRLEQEEYGKSIKSADVRNKINALRQDANARRTEMVLVGEEINELSAQLRSEQ